MAHGLIVTADDIIKAVKEAEFLEQKALELARERDKAEGKHPRVELHPDRTRKPGREIVLDYIKNPDRRAVPRCSIKVMSRDNKGSGTGNGYAFLLTVPMVRNRELADNIAKDIEAFMDYLLDEYDIPKRQRNSRKTN